MLLLSSSMLLFELRLKRERKVGDKPSGLVPFKHTHTQLNTLQNLKQITTDYEDETTVKQLHQLSGRKNR